MSKKSISDRTIALQCLSAKENLLMTATRLFIEHGYINTGIRQLAHACHVSSATIYSHFPTKNAIAEEIIFQALSYCHEFIFPQLKMHQGDFIHIASLLKSYFKERHDALFVFLLAHEFSYQPKLGNFAKIYFQEWQQAFSDSLLPVNRIFLPITPRIIFHGLTGIILISVLNNKISYLEQNIDELLCFCKCMDTVNNLNKE